MPLYEYRCRCGAEEEVIESHAAPAEHACPACGAPEGMRRQLSKAGFVLSGGGWYASGYGSGAKESATEGKAAGDSAAPKAESAPATGASAGCGGGCSCH